MTEGRKAFFKGLAGIESGAECERLAPQLSALADGEASAEDLRLLRPHLRSCLACRARLREFRAAPKRVAALLPPLAATTHAGGIRSFLESLLGAAQHKAAALGERAHTAAELATGQKVAAVAATAAAVAGGGAGVKELTAAEDPPARVHQAPQHKPAPTRALTPNSVTPAAAPKPPPPAQPQPQPLPQPAPKPPPSDPAAEFSPAAAPAPPASPPPSGGPAPARSAGSGGAGEFGP